MVTVERELLERRRDVRILHRDLSGYVGGDQRGAPEQLADERCADALGPRDPRTGVLELQLQAGAVELEEAS